MYHHKTQATNATFFFYIPTLRTLNFSTLKYTHTHMRQQLHFHESSQLTNRAFKGHLRHNRKQWKFSDKETFQEEHCKSCRL